MKPRVAIACSGLGHVRRGNETWAATVADALHASGLDITLLGGGSMDDVNCPYVRVRNWRRDHPVTRSWISWHYRYILEQGVFAFHLQQWLKRNPHDIVHTGDPILALHMQRWNWRQRPRVVYKDGLLLGPAWSGKFDCAHLLAPQYLEYANASGANTRNWFVIPHLVDTQRFAPPPDRHELRARVFRGTIPADAVVFLAVGAFSPRDNKRLEWIVQEFSLMPPARDVHLVLAGQSGERDRQEFEHEAERLLPGRVHFFINQTPAQMVELYQVADVFVHAALREPFGIVFLEAMACGLPVIAHTYPVSQWIVGDGGQCLEMTLPGRLTDAFIGIYRDAARRVELGRRARQRVIQAFARERIVPLYHQMYDRTLKAGR